MKPKDIRERWNAEFPDQPISSGHNGRTLIDTGHRRALKLITKLKKTKKLSALDVH